MESRWSTGMAKRAIEDLVLQAAMALSGRHGRIPETSSASSASYAGAGYPMTADSSPGLQS